MWGVICVHSSSRRAKVGRGVWKRHHPATHKQVRLHLRRSVAAETPTTAVILGPTAAGSCGHTEPGVAA